MIVTEQIKSLNRRLLDIFGRWEDYPRFRIVFSDDEFETAFGTYNDYTDGGIFLREVTEWRKVPKYRTYIHSKWILETIVSIPVVNQRELYDKVSYECIWVFEDKDHNALPPKWEVIELVIYSLYQQAAKSIGVKYKDPEINEPIHERDKRIKRLESELFGNESEITDALHYKEGISVPSNFERSKES